MKLDIVDIILGVCLCLCIIVIGVCSVTQVPIPQPLIEIGSGLAFFLAGKKTPQTLQP